MRPDVPAHYRGGLRQLQQTHLAESVSGPRQPAVGSPGAARKVAMPASPAALRTPIGRRRRESRAGARAGTDILARGGAHPVRHPVWMSGSWLPIRAVKALFSGQQSWCLPDGRRPGEGAGGKPARRGAGSARYLPSRRQRTEWKCVTPAPFGAGSARREASRQEPAAAGKRTERLRTCPSMLVDASRAPPCELLAVGCRREAPSRTGDGHLESGASGRRGARKDLADLPHLGGSGR